MKDLLQKYKDNALSEAETEAVEKQMLATIMHNEQKQKWTTLLAENGIERQPKVVRKLSTMRYIMGLAATVFIAAAMWWTMGKSGDLSSMELTDKYMSEQFANPSTRDAKDELSEWSAAKQAYAKKDFATAIKNLDAIGGPNDEQVFYKSLSFMYQTPPNLDKASEGFVQLLRKNQNFADESQWFYILIALKKGEKDAAISMLENVIGKQNSYSEKAAILLKKLK
jgi:tetratricopeptide (TPR) repeat protein